MYSWNLKRLQVIQNKGLRAIFYLKRRISLAPFYKKATLLNVKSIIELSLAKISHRYTNDVLPLRIVNLFEHTNHDHQTRNRNTLQAIAHTSHIYNKSFLGRAPSIWLHLPNELKHVKDQKQFNKKYIKFRCNVH